MSNSEMKHIILHAPPFWGHNKALVALAVRFARARPNVIVSLITAKVIYSNAVGEFEKKLEKEELCLLRPRINIIDIAGPLSNFVEPLSEFLPVYEALYNESKQGIVCKSSGRTFIGLPRPVVAIVDSYAGYAFEAIGTISQNKVPILSWLCTPPMMFLHHIGPKALGGNAPDELESEEGRKKVKEWLSSKPTKGDSSVAVQPQIKLYPYYQSSKVQKISIPGAPPMYAHELSPQIRPAHEGKLIAVGGVYIREGAGIIMASNSTYEKETMHTVKKWFEEMGQIAYGMSPLALPELETQENQSNDENKEVVQFLDAVKDRFGPQSLVYISFGTFSHPPEPEKLEALIETFILNETPFFLCHASPLPIATLSDNLETLIKETGFGMAKKWSPQQTILQHEATGWFITHGGWNGIQESFASRVPMIFWPMAHEQPVNAAQIVILHKAAFELIEVRSGEPGRKPLLRFQDTGYTPTFTVDAVRKEVKGILTKIRGEEGQTVRENFNRLCESMWRSWDKEGVSNVDLEHFLSKFVDYA